MNEPEKTLHLSQGVRSKRATTKNKGGNNFVKQGENRHVKSRRLDQNRSAILCSHLLKQNKPAVTDRTYIQLDRFLMYHNC